MTARKFGCLGLVVGMVLGGVGCATETEEPIESGADEVAVQARVSGSRVKSFGDNGVKTAAEIDETGFSVASDEIRDSKGRTLKVAQSEGRLPHIERRLSNGAIDRTFGNGGIATLIGFEQDADAVIKIVPDTQGRTIAFRSDRNEYRYGGTRTSIARIREDGLLDVTFGNSGFVDESLLDHEEAIRSVVRLPNDAGYLLVGERKRDDAYLGFWTHSCYLDTYLVKLDSSGERVRSYDEDGVVVHRFGYSSAIIGTRIVGKDQLEILGVQGDEDGDWRGSCRDFTAASKGPRFLARVWL